jgi:hypothetical protein
MTRGLLLLALIACGDSHPITGTDAGTDDRDAAAGGDPDGGAPALDADGDGIPDSVEHGPGSIPRDTDGDGIPDIDDLDSDGDTISDRDEGERDFDRDDLPSYLDLDSDGDGIDDAIEAGDADVATPPVECAIESIPGITGGDGRADAFDDDSDNDGVPDATERELGTDRCSLDTDGDGVGDLVEVGRTEITCPDGETGFDCTCAIDASCGPRADEVVITLPYKGEPMTRTLSFGTLHGQADVLFLVDTTGAMAGTVHQFRNAGPFFTERIREVVGESAFALATHDDAPVSPYGSSFAGDVAYRLVAPFDSGRPIDADFRDLAIHGGGDAPQSATLALHEIGLGTGGTWAHGADSFSIETASCEADRRGGACFRRDARPIVLHFTETCQHNGPPGSDPLCDPYTGFMPALATFDQAMESLLETDARYVGINSGSESCRSPAGPLSPCAFMRAAATATGTVDFDGNPWVFDLPGVAAPIVFQDTVIQAIEAALHRTRIDVTTSLADDPSDPDSVDATQFIEHRRPSCTGGGDSACWTEPEGIAHDDAVLSVDMSGFFGVVPGTAVSFDVTFRNDVYVDRASPRVFAAYIELTTPRGTLLDRRLVFIVVPPAFEVP